MAMGTIQNVDSSQIEFTFFTDFNGSIVLSFDVDLYSHLKEVLVLNYKSLMNALGKTDLPTSPKKKEQLPNQKNFRCKEGCFELNPTLHFLGESTPSLEKVLSLLGIKDSQTFIPTLIHNGLTDSMENMLLVLWNIIFLLQNIGKMYFQ